MKKLHPIKSQAEKNLFQEIHDSIAKELQKTNEIIIDSSKGKADLIADISNYLVSSGGKRIRPILTIISSKLCGYSSGTRHCNLAAAVELIHTATLLHDDVVDESNLRRGKPTANSVWNNKSSILVGDYLFSVSFQLMVKDGSIEVLETLSKTSGIMADGEVMQLMNSNDVKITQEDYLDIISCKTAILFSAATKVGAIITNQNEEKKKNLNDFGNNLGIAFQIIDDILDYKSDEKTLGKKIGNDFFEGKVTLPIILTYNQANDLEKAQIQKLFTNNLINEEDDPKSFEEIMSLINKYDTLNQSTQIAINYQNLAKEKLNSFPDGEEKSMLISILEYGISRKS
ncbi:MAG: octaprenyl-diphosphate synthase [Lentimonas sp.]|jgi:octaprenyl-diphosphate synthase